VTFAPERIRGARKGNAVLQNENQPCECCEQDTSCISEHEGRDQTVGCRAGQAAAQLLWEGAMEKGVAKEADIFNSPKT